MKSVVPCIGLSFHSASLNVCYTSYGLMTYPPMVPK